MQRMATPSRRLWILIALGIVLVLALDQWLKVWVKTHMTLGQEFMLLGQWARIHFLENEGIAFGLSPNSQGGKLFISLSRILASAAMVAIMIYAVRKRTTPLGVVVGVAGLIAGALGNVIDGTFYGLLFSSSEGLVLQGEQLVQPLAQLFPEGGGYAPLFHGKVVDMFYFPLFSFYWPEWIPFCGGQRFEFFQPVFNLADAVITGSVFYLIIFQWRFLFTPKRKDAVG